MNTVEALDALKIALNGTKGLLMSVRLVAMLSHVAMTMGSTSLLVSTAVESLALSISAMGRNGAIGDLLRSSAIRWLLCVLIVASDSSC